MNRLLPTESFCHMLSLVALDLGLTTERRDQVRLSGAWGPRYEDSRTEPEPATTINSHPSGRFKTASRSLNMIS
jgi:hypothetical protein